MGPLSITIQGGYSAIPSEMTVPRLTYKITVPDPTLDEHKMLQRRMHIICFYNKRSGDEVSGWHLGGWIKESLGRALVEEPILAGRLRRSDDGGLEIVSNDSGMRCLEAQTPMSLVEFLESKDKHEVEAELVYWNDVDETDPHFSPLCYVQVTNFQCGGYSVSLSCSLLLADPFIMGKILNKWAETHQNIAYEGETPKMPVFYSPKFKHVACSDSLSAFPISTTNPSTKASKTEMFSISIDEKLNPGEEICKYLVQLCIEEAEKKVGSKMSLNFTLITKQPNGDVKVERSSKQSTFGSPKSLRYELNALSWEELRTNEVAFGRENVPIDVSHWVACDALEGMVLVVLSSPNEGKSDMNIFVTVPN